MTPVPDVEKHESYAKRGKRNAMRNAGSSFKRENGIKRLKRRFK